MGVVFVSLDDEIGIVSPELQNRLTAIMTARTPSARTPARDRVDNHSQRLLR
jgi:hypothetical protein